MRLVSLSWALGQYVERQNDALKATIPLVGPSGRTSPLSVIEPYKRVLALTVRH